MSQGTLNQIMNPYKKKDATELNDTSEKLHDELMDTSIATGATNTRPKSTAIQACAALNTIKNLRKKLNLDDTVTANFENNTENAPKTNRVNKNNNKSRQSKLNSFSTGISNEIYLIFVYDHFNTRTYHTRTSVH